MGLDFPLQPIDGALLQNPMPEVGVGRILAWHEAVTEVLLESAQLVKSYAPYAGQTSPAPVETNTLELSNTLRCHATWLSFLI